jgi:hypothetical protein
MAKTSCLQAEVACGGDLSTTAARFDTNSLASSHCLTFYLTNYATTVTATTHSAATYLPEPESQYPLVAEFDHA